jgi:hypothetical protein
LDFAGSTVSFDLPEDVINDGSSFQIAIRYSDVAGDQQNTSSGGPVYAAVIPEPTTALLGALGFLMLLRRSR